MKNKEQHMKGRRVLVVGLGLSGQSAAKFLLNRGAQVTGTDRNRSISTANEAVAGLCHQGMTFIHEDEACHPFEYDLIVVSPGIPPTHPCYQKAAAMGLEVIGEVELACREITQKCLAVTGTNGKTTVTMLTEHVLQQAGKKAMALGNIGIPLTSAVDAHAHDDTEIFVIELSSFQLETLHCRFIDAGVLLNITPDHLDRYPSMREYAAAKIRMEDCLKVGGRLFVEENCYRNHHAAFTSRIYTYGYDSSSYLHTDTHAVYCQGKKVFALPANFNGKRSHDLENILAAYALCCHVGILPEVFLAALSTFKKPSHRIEFVRTVGGVQYYDDSKGTNIDAVIRAVSVLEGKIILIAGGVDKGFPYTSWIPAFDGKVKTVCAIGQSKEKIKADICGHIPVELFSTLQEAVSHAANIAQAGDTVLLSPGCSSYDMFKDYAHRGHEFQRIINAL